MKRGFDVELEAGPEMGKATPQRDLSMFSGGVVRAVLCLVAQSCPTLCK